MTAGNTAAAIDKLAGLIVGAINRRMAGMSSLPTGATAGSTASAASGGAGSAVSAITGFAGKLLAILAPISVAAAVLGSATSGLSTFVGTLKILGATVGTLLAPVFLVLAAAALSVTDLLQSQLLPNLTDLQTYLLNLGQNAVSNLQDMFMSLAVKILTLVNQTDQLTERFGGVIGVLDKFLTYNPYTALQYYGAKKLFGGSGDTPDAKAEAEKQVTDAFNKLKAKLLGGGNAAGGNAPAGDNAGRGFMGLFRDNLQVALNQMKHESGPAAQQTGLLQASMNAQMAAFMSPFERKQLELQEKNLQSLQEAVNAIKRLQPAVGH